MGLSLLESTYTVSSTIVRAPGSRRSGMPFRTPPKPDAHCSNSPRVSVSNRVEVMSTTGNCDVLSTSYFTERSISEVHLYPITRAFRGSLTNNLGSTHQATTPIRNKPAMIRRLVLASPSFAIVPATVSGPCYFAASTRRILPPQSSTRISLFWSSQKAFGFIRPLPFSSRAAS
jgi:hypothetical protein